MIFCLLFRSLLFLILKKYYFSKKKCDYRIRSRSISLFMKRIWILPTLLKSISINKDEQRPVGSVNGSPSHVVCVPVQCTCRVHLLFSCHILWFFLLEFLGQNFSSRTDTHCDL